MVRKILLVMAAVLFIFGISKISFAMMCGGHAGHQQTAQQEDVEHKHMKQEDISEAAPHSAVNVGSKVCPVSGEEIDERLKVTYEYEGKVYNFCCASCIDEFKKDPEKYIKKVEEELESELKEESKHEEHEMQMMQEPETSHEGMHQGHHHSH